MPKIIKLSKITIALGLYIIISASFARQAWDFFGSRFGQNNIQTVFVLLFFLAAAFLAFYIFRPGRGFLKALGSMIVLCFIFIFMSRLEIFVEKIHVFEYGLLGWLALKDLSCKRSSPMNIFLAFLFVLVVGVIDEGFQRLLPYRVGEVRDIIINVVSGSCGIAIFLLK